MPQKKNVDKKNIRRLRNTLSSSNYSLRIFSKIYAGYRPSLIAKQLGISIQNVHYYTKNLVDLELIEKLGDRSGISWKVTERGLFVLKQFLRGSVNSYNNQNNSNSLFYDAKIPVRLHNVSFAFKIDSSLEHLRIQWKDMKNGVSRHTIIKKNNQEGHTVDLFRSPNDENSVVLVNMNEVYTFNIFQELIKLYEAARTTAVRIAADLCIHISATGELVKKPHFAFEDDLIALYLATFETASTKTKKGRAWIDASQGVGELETNDPDYAYKYLTMPEGVFDIYNDIKRMESKISGYKRCYDPIITENN
jgi:DNA-binding MarR family transcriptional regulator